jgi:hypothetical protein
MTLCVPLVQPEMGNFADVLPIFSCMDVNEIGSSSRLCYCWELLLHNERLQGKPMYHYQWRVGSWKDWYAELLISVEAMYTVWVLWQQRRLLTTSLQSYACFDLYRGRQASMNTTLNALHIFTICVFPTTSSTFLTRFPCSTRSCNTSPQCLEANHHKSKRSRTWCWRPTLSWNHSDVRRPWRTTTPVVTYVPYDPVNSQIK